VSLNLLVYIKARWICAKDMLAPKMP